MFGLVLKVCGYQVNGFNTVLKVVIVTASLVCFKMPENTDPATNKRCHFYFGQKPFCSSTDRLAAVRKEMESHSCTAEMLLSSFFPPSLFCTHISPGFLLCWNALQNHLTSVLLLSAKGTDPGCVCAWLRHERNAFILWEDIKEAGFASNPLSSFSFFLSFKAFYYSTKFRKNKSVFKHPTIKVRVCRCTVCACVSCQAQ